MTCFKVKVQFLMQKLVFGKFYLNYLTQKSDFWNMYRMQLKTL